MGISRVTGLAALTLYQMALNVLESALQERFSQEGVILAAVQRRFHSTGRRISSSMPKGDPPFRKLQRFCSSG